MAPQSVFATKKAKILSQLATPLETYTDLSPKGSVDAPIRDLVDAINAIPSLVTTSSCSGRIAIYSAPSGSGPKGGGRWLFVSHDPLSAIPPSLSDLLASRQNEMAASDQITISQYISPPSFHSLAPLVHLKFEPLILHVLCASPSAARSLLAAAQAAGFRESGIASLPAPPTPSLPTSSTLSENGYAKRVRKPQKEEGPVMLAIRTMGLGMDAPIAVVEENGFRLVVDEAYISSLLGVANARFKGNEERKGRLAEGINNAFAAEIADAS